MVEIYEDYGQEPDPEFQPLTAQRKSAFYDLEMDSYQEDISFYTDLLPADGFILELGCGSGRVTRQLVTRKRTAVGLDLCLHSLQKAHHRQSPGTSYVCMDMRHLAFAKQFSAVIIPYNSINLLHSIQDILCCLHSCNAVMEEAGSLLAQIFLSSQQLRTSSKKTFQFQMFDRPGGGKIIKEILTEYKPLSQTVEIEERYRVRPLQKGLMNEDWNQKYNISAFSLNEWHTIFTKTGFKPIHLYSDYSTRSSIKKDSSRLYVHLKKQII